MEATNIVTIKGTTTIPAGIRRVMGLEPGSLVTFHYNPAKHTTTITKTSTLADLRRRNVQKKLKLTAADIEQARTGWIQEQSA